MDTEAVIAHLLEIPGSSRGKSASPSHKDYSEADGLEFIECPCAAASPNWDYPEFIAETPNGAYIYIGCDSRRRIISIGRKGYHAPDYEGGRCPAMGE